jgi:hypothetical protein
MQNVARSVTKMNRLSRPDGRIILRTIFFASLCWTTGCATGPDTEALVDPLKQRLLAREDIALQNLLLARTPAYSYAGGSRSGSSSYLDAPYVGPSIEPPLPDLNLLPEDMPPWEEFPEETPAPEPQPTPMEPVPTGDEPTPAPTPAPAPEAIPEPTPEATATPDAAPNATPAPSPETSAAAEPPPAP